MLLELSSGANASNAQQQQNPFSPVSVSTVNTQQQPQPDLHYYEDISNPFGGFSQLENIYRNADKIYSQLLDIFRNRCILFLEKLIFTFFFRKSH